VQDRAACAEVAVVDRLKPFAQKALPKRRLTLCTFMDKVLPNGDPRSGKFRHWKLFSKHLSQAFEKTQKRRAEDVCIGMWFKPVSMQASAPEIKMTS
jgi:hypothetical protein